MDLIDKLREIASRIHGKLDHLKTEEATKNALVMPFINALGYNVFDPAQVVPEFVADVGVKKGEKVDYAILHDGDPIIGTSPIRVFAPTRSSASRGPSIRRPSGPSCLLPQSKQNSSPESTT